MYVVLLINVNIKLNTWNLHIYYAGRRQRWNLFLTLLHSTVCKRPGSQICILGAGISGLIFSKCDSGLCSGQLRALNSQRRKGKKFSTPPPWLQPQRNLGWETSFFNSVFLLINSVLVITVRSSCSAYDLCVCDNCI